MRAIRFIALAVAVCLLSRSALADDALRLKAISALLDKALELHDSWGKVKSAKDLLTGTFDTNSFNTAIAHASALSGQLAAIELPDQPAALAEALDKLSSIQKQLQSHWRAAFEGQKVLEETVRSGRSGIFAEQLTYYWLELEPVKAAFSAAQSQALKISGKARAKLGAGAKAITKDEAAALLLLLADAARKAEEAKTADNAQPAATAPVMERGRDGVYAPIFSAEERRALDQIARDRAAKTQREEDLAQRELNLRRQAQERERLHREEMAEAWARNLVRDATAKRSELRKELDELGQDLALAMKDARDEAAHASQASVERAEKLRSRLEDMLSSMISEIAAPNHPQHPTSHPQPTPRKKLEDLTRESVEAIVEEVSRAQGIDKKDIRVFIDVHWGDGQTVTLPKPP